MCLCEGVPVREWWSDDSFGSLFSPSVWVFVIRQTQDIRGGSSTLTC